MQDKKPNDLTNINSNNNGPFKRTITNKVVRIRENYIIARDKNANKAKVEVQQLLNSPRFNRFISLKKCDIANSQALLAKYKIHQQIERKPLEKNFNRRQLYFMRQRRPDHNSPIKTRAEDQLLRQINKSQTRNKDMLFIPSKNIPPPQNQAQNTLFIKKLVTHVQQPRKARKPIQNPYSPPSSNKYYVAEIIKHYSNQESLARDHLDNSMYFLQLFAKYNEPANQPQVYPLSLRQKEKYKDKITVVFDLDETLVHCFEDRSQPHQIELPVRFSGGREMLAPINIRPGAHELLAELSQDFQIMIFTASHESYADEVINYLDPKREYVQHRLYRRNCECIEDTYYIKDLRVIGRDLSRIVLVDNAAYSYCFQVTNGIPIIPYYEGDHDYELKALKQYLFSLKGVSDVRQANKQAFCLQEYHKFNSVDQLVSELYL